MNKLTYNFKIISMKILSKFFLIMKNEKIEF